MRLVRSCLIVCLVIFVASCGSKPEKKVVGKWIGDDITIEFFDEGTVSVSGGMFGQPTNGDYRFIDNDRLRLDLGGPLAAVGPVIFRVKFSGDELSLVDSSGDACEFKRAGTTKEYKRAGTAKSAREVTEKPTKLDSMESEARMCLSAIRNCEEYYRSENDVYIECKPCPPNGGTDATPDPWPDSATEFSKIGFEPDGNVRYQYSVKVSADGRSFVATAISDLNENGVKATLTIDSSSPEYPKIIKHPENEY